MDVLLDPNLWIAFAMLTALEIVLGVDNIIFISILVGRLPPAQRDRARRLGLGFAMLSRLVLLFSLTWVMGLTEDLFTAVRRRASADATSSCCSAACSCSTRPRTRSS